MKNLFDIIWLDDIDSTNNEAKRRINDIDNLSVLSALSQNAGRGQRGNSWISERAKNLLFSIILKYQSEELPHMIKAKEQFVINEITSLSIVDFLKSHGIEAAIKWPNDIYINDSKICGILIENALKGEELSSSIVGIGLNINQRNFNVSLTNPTSMICESKAMNEYDISQCLEEFMQIFAEYIDLYLVQNNSELSLRKNYLSKLWRLDKAAEFIDHTDNDTDGKRFIGIIKGLSRIGHLLVEDTRSGEIREFKFKELSYVL